MNKFRLNIDGKEVLGIPGQTILEVAKENDIFIPTLCYDERTEIYGACGLCVVEVEGNPKLCKACATTIGPNMVIKTNTERVIESRKTNLELLLSTHDQKCLSCVRSGNCELQKLCKDFRIYDEAKYDGEKPESDYDDSAVHMVRDNSKCVLCRRCAAACAKWQDVAVIGLPDSRLGEIATAIIEVKKGMELTEDEVNEFCLELPRYKRPRKIIFASVPRNPTGKIEKPKLRKMYGAEGLVDSQNKS